MSELCDLCDTYSAYWWYPSQTFRVGTNTRRETHYDLCESCAVSLEHSRATFVSNLRDRYRDEKGRVFGDVPVPTQVSLTTQWEATYEAIRAATRDEPRRLLP